MKGFVAALLLAMLTATPALADWDAEADAQERAKYEAEIKRAQEKERQAQQMKQDAQRQYDAAVIQDKRKALGAAAKGKSDAEVNALYDAKIKKDTAEAHATAAKAQKALRSGEGAAAVKQVTGRSMADLQNMSDEELEALSRQMEQQYGQ